MMRSGKIIRTRQIAPWMSGGRQGSSERGTKRGGNTIVNPQSDAYKKKNILGLIIFISISYPEIERNSAICM